MFGFVDCKLFSAVNVASKDLNRQDTVCFRIRAFSLPWCCLSHQRPRSHLVRHPRHADKETRGRYHLEMGCLHFVSNQPKYWGFSDTATVPYRSRPARKLGQNVGLAVEAVTCHLSVCKASQGIEPDDLPTACTASSGALLCL